MATELFTNNPFTTVSAGGTTAPSGGTVETWTVASSTAFPAATTGVSQFHVADPVLPSELIAVTNVSGTTWTVTRGAESTTPVAHPAGFAVQQVVSAGFLTSPVFAGAISTAGLAGATAASRYVGATTSGAPVSGTFADGDWVIDQAGKVWICTAAGAPGTWTAAGPPVPLTIAQGGTGQTTAGAALNALGGAAVAGDIGGTSASPQVTGTHLASALPIAQGGTGQGTQQSAINALAGTQTLGYILGSDGTNVKMVPDGGVTWKVPAPTGLTATDTPNVQAAITKLTTAGGNGTLLFQDGTYQVDSNALVIRSCSNFAVKGTGATIISQAPNRSGLATNTTGDLMVIADCTDLRVEEIIFDALRDTVSPATPLSASAASGQPSVTVATGSGARYLAGQRLQLFGGLGSSEQGQSENFPNNTNGGGLVISSITAGGGAGGGDLITFTSNLANTYTQISATAFSDGFGPYAYAGAYLSPYQTGNQNSVAGRTLSSEDQQNGLHLLTCKRFTITRVTSRNLWESGIKLGTGLATTTLTDGCQQGVISDCVTYHGYDQGISVWVSQQITVRGCIANASGWAGISLTGSDRCAVTGNQVISSVYRVPNDTASGSGIVTEGGVGNQIKGNIITTPYSDGVRTNNSPIFFGLAVGTYPTTSTFLEAGTAAGTSVQLSATSALTAGGLYSILDGQRSEAITIASIVDGTHVTLAGAITFSHQSGVYIVRRVAQEDVVEGNTIVSPGAHGINAHQSARCVYKNNMITGYGVNAGNGSHGVDLTYNSLSLPAGQSLGGAGALVEGNVIGNGAGAGIEANGVSGVLIRANRVYSPNGFGPGIEAKGVSDSAIEGNQITDIRGSYGIWAQPGGPSTTACLRVAISGNVIRRCQDQGILLSLGDSMTVTGNIVQSCGTSTNAGIDLQGTTRSVAEGNVSNSNQNAGIMLEDSGANYCLYNRVTGNTTRDTADGINVTSGASWTQQHGIVEAGNSNFNIITGNETDSNALDQLTTVGAATLAWANVISGAMSGALPVTAGGTGDASLGAYQVLAGGTASTGAVQSVSGVGSTGQVLTSNGAATLPTWQNVPSGFTNPMTTLGDLIYEDATPVPVRLPGNTTAAKNYLTQTGNGTISAVPAWAAIAAADLPSATSSVKGAVMLGGTNALSAAPVASEPSFTPSDTVSPALLAWNYDPIFLGGSGTPTTNGQVYLMGINIRQAISVTSISLYITSGGSVLTASQNFAGLYTSAGTLVGATADQSGNWTSSGVLRTMALSGGPFAVSPGYCWIAILTNGTTAPSFGRLNLISNAGNNIGFTAATCRSGFNGTGQTSLPGSITPSANTLTNVTFWGGLS